MASCHDKEVESVATIEQKTQEFEEGFKEAFTRNINPNQTWGFTSGSEVASSRALTRSAYPNAADGNSDWILPNIIESAESLKVVQHFQNPSKYTSSVNPGYKNYWVQQVHKGTNSYQEQNKVSGSTQTATNVSNNMNYLYVIENGTQVHIERFNSGDGSRMLMVSSNTNVFGYHNSLGSDFQDKYLIQQIDGAYYVGFDYASNANDHYVEADGTYDDWIVKLVPATKSTTTNPTPTEIHYAPEGGVVIEDLNLDSKTTTTITEYFKKRTLLQYGRVFCEDLGGSYKSNRKDFDYNDVVFDAYLWKEELWKKVTIVNTYEVKAYKESTRTEVELVYDANGQPVYKKKEDGSYMTDGNGNKIQETKSSEVTDIIRYEEKDSKRSYQYGTPEYSKVDNDSTWFYADICLLACGATKPIKVGGNDADEVHYAFGGYSVDCIINTFDEHSPREGGFGYHETVAPITYTQVDITKYVRENNNFDNPTINDIPIYVQWSGIAAKNIQAKRGEVPQKYMTTGKDKWTSERCFLGNAYPSFTNWVESADSLLNTSVQGEASLYNSYPGAGAGLDFNVAIGEATTTCLPILTNRTTKVSEDNSTLVINELYDENGNFKEILSGEPENVQPGGQGGQGGGGQQGDSSNSVVLVTPSNPVSSGNIVTDRETVQSYYEKMASGRSKITVTISPTEDKWNYLTFSYGGDQGEIFSVHGSRGNAGTDYSNYGKGQTFTITWYIDVDTLYSKLLSNQYWFPGGLFHVKGDQATIVGLTLYF